MMRVRLKADGRIVEILPDGSERALASQLDVAMRMRHRMRWSAPATDGRAAGCRLCPRRAGAHQAHAGAVRRPHRRADRDGAQLGAGQALAARAGPRALKVIDRAPDVAFAVLRKTEN